MSVLPKTICRFSPSHVKNPSYIFTDLKKKPHPEIRVESQPQVANIILNKKNKTGGPTLPDFKTYTRPQ